MSAKRQTIGYRYRKPIEADLDEIGVRMEQGSSVVYEEEGTPRVFEFRHPELDEDGKPGF